MQQIKMFFSVDLNEYVEKGVEKDGKGVRKQKTPPTTCVLKCPIVGFQSLEFRNHFWTDRPLFVDLGAKKQSVSGPSSVLTYLYSLQQSKANRSLWN